MASDASPPAAPSPSPEEDAPEPKAEANRLNRLTAFETTLIAGGVILFLVLLYEMKTPPREAGFLNPVLIATAGAILLWPLRHYRTVRALMLSGGFLVLIWFFDKVSAILIPFAIVYLLAYLLNPAVDLFRRRYGVARWLSSLLVTLIAVGILVAIVLILAPNVASQVESLAQRLITGVDSLRTWLQTTTLIDNLEAAGFIDRKEAIAQLTTFVQDQISRLPDAARQLAESIGSLLGLITVLALVPVLLFYTLKDYPVIRDALIELFPTLEGRRDYLLDAGAIVGNYLRGQILISTISAVNVSIWLLIGGVPFGLLIGLLSGLLNFIPNIGAIITMFIGTVVALTLGGWVKALIVIVVLLGQGLLEQSVLTPNIMSYQVGLHPLLVLLSLLVFGSFLGVFGLLIAVPVTAILMTGYRAYREELTLDLNEYSTPPEAQANANDG